MGGRVKLIRNSSGPFCHPEVIQMINLSHAEEGLKQIPTQGLIEVDLFFFKSESSHHQPVKDLLVGGWTNPSEKYARQNGFIFPKFRGENSKNVWNHNLDMDVSKNKACPKMDGEHHGKPYEQMYFNASYIFLVFVLIFTPRTSAFTHL